MRIKIFTTALAMLFTTMVAQAQYERALQGVIELVDFNNRIVIIDEKRYRFSSSTVFTDDGDTTRSNVSIADFNPGSVVQFDVTASDRLRYMSLISP